MGVFGFVSWSIVIIATVTLLWPLNIPLIALAFKVRNGQKPVDMEPKEFWTRSTFGALGLALLGLFLLLATYVFTVYMKLPFGPTQLTVLLFYLPIAVWYVFWMFALEDMGQALSLYLVYILLAGLPLLGLGHLFGIWNRLGKSLPWLWSTTERALLP